MVHSVQRQSVGLPGARASAPTNRRSFSRFLPEDLLINPVPLDSGYGYGRVESTSDRRLRSRERRLMVAGPPRLPRWAVTSG